MGTSLAVIKKKKKAKTKVVSLEKKVSKFKNKFKDDLKDTDIEGVKSLYGRQSKKINELLKNGDIEKAVQLSNVTMFRMLSSLMPIAEKKYRKYGNERSAYAMNSLISQVRELAADMESLKDRKELVNRVVMNIIQPNFMLIAQNLVSAAAALNRELEETVEPKKKARAVRSINAYTQQMAQYLTDVYKTIETKIHAEMAE